MIGKVAFALALIGAAPAFAAGYGIQGSPLVITDVTGTSQCLHADTTGKVSGVGGECLSTGASNVFTGNNTFQTGTFTFKVDPLISSGGSATDGAIFFGTNLGSRFLSYDHTNNGGVGGYALGSTFGASDTLFAGPIHLGAGAGVLIQPGASGSWTLTLPTSSGTNGQVLTTNGSGVTSWVSVAATAANPSAAAGPAAVNGAATTYMRSDAAPRIDLTASYSWSALHSFSVDPVISSGGSATDGAIFFGTNSGSRFISYDHTNNGGVGGYALGSTFGASDTLFAGPVHMGGAVGVLLQPGASGSWTLTLPTSGGTNGQVLTTNGSGGTSWTSAGGSTGANPTATGGPNAVNGSATTFMRSDAAPAIQKGTNAQFGIVEGDGTTLTCASGVCSMKGNSVSGGFSYIAMGNNTYLEYGGVALSGGTVTVTWPHAVSTGIASLVATAVSGSSCVITTNGLSTTQGTFTGGAGCGGSEVVNWQMLGN